MIFAKIINDDEGQTVSLPQQTGLSGDEICIHSPGEGTLLMDKDKVDEMFADSIRDIAEGRTFSQQEVDEHMKRRFASFKGEIV